jgi:hypothetical protein
LKTAKAQMTEMTSPKCPKCKVDPPIEMEEGFLLDNDATAKQAQWVLGKPEASFWGGLKVAPKDRYFVRSFRCTQCGFLEDYATGKVP